MGHGLGTRGGQVAEGQQEELAQFLFVLAALGKVRDEADVLQIAALRGVAHEEVLAHQELDQTHVGRNESQARGNAFGEHGALFVVGRPERLAHVVQEHGHEQGQPPRDRGELGRHLRVFPRHLAPRDGLQGRHRIERVLVHRIHVIHVVLHPAHQRLPLRNERADESQIVHLFQARGRAGIARVDQNLQEGRGRFAIFAQGRAASGGILGNQVGRAPAHRQVRLNRKCEKPNNLRRFIFKDDVLLYLNCAVRNLEARVPLAALGHAHGVHGRLMVAISADPQQQALGFPADRARVTLKIVHERLHRRCHRGSNLTWPCRGVGMEEPRNAFLEIETKLFLAPARGQVHGCAHPQEPFPGRFHGRSLTGRHLAHLIELLRVSGLEAHLSCPPPHAQIANSTRAAFQVRLEHEYRVTEARMAAVLFRTQARHKAVRRGLGHARLVARQEPIREISVAGQKPRIEQGGGRSQIGGGQSQGIGDRTHRMPSIHLGIPEGNQDGAGQVFHRAVRRLRAKEKQVQIRIGRQFAPAEPARGQHGDLG